MYCPNCSAEVLASALECWNCSAKFGGGASWKPVLAPVGPMREFSRQTKATLIEDVELKPPSRFRSWLIDLPLWLRMLVGFGIVAAWVYGGFFVFLFLVFGLAAQAQAGAAWPLLLFVLAYVIVGPTAVFLLFKRPS